MGPLTGALSDLPLTSLLSSSRDSPLHTHDGPMGGGPSFNAEVTGSAR